MTDQPDGRRRAYSRLVRGLVVLGSVIAILAIFSVWVERQVFDTSSWVDTSGRLLENEKIQSAVATFAVDQLYAHVDVEKEIQKKLPTEIQPLSGPVASGLRTVAQTAATKLLGTSRFQGLWRKANSAAHTQFVNIVEDRQGGVTSAKNGEVSLHLRPLITALAGQLGLSSSVTDKLPADVGTLSILRADQIDLAQKIARWIRGLALISSLLALACFAVAVYLARGYRWIAVLGVGLGVILAAIVALIIRELAGGAVVDALAAQTAHPAADSAWSISTSLLASVAHGVLLFGGFFVFAAWLASPHPSSAAARRFLAPVLRDQATVVWVLFGLVSLIFLIPGLGSTRVELTRLILIAIAGAGLFELRRHAIRENPDADLGQLLSGARERLAGISLPSRAGAPSVDPQQKRLDALERLATLHERGALTKKEFDAEKKALLAADSAPSTPSVAE